MFYLDYINQVDFLTIACFSFLTGIYILCLYKTPEPERYFGTGFLSAFGLAAGSFLSYREVASAILISASKTIILLSILVTLIVKPQKYKTGFIVLPFILAPGAWRIANSFFYRTEDLLLFIDFLLPGLFALGCLIKLRKLQQPDRLFNGIVLFLLSILLKYISAVNYLYYISLLLQTAGLALIFLHFYSRTVACIDQKAVEAQTKLNDIERIIKIETRKRTREIEQTNRKLLDLSKTDSLTKACNKATIIEIIDSTIKRNPLNELTVLMFDIDDFKNLNDSQGHVKGDLCLRKLASIARSCIRDIDSLGRYGGDEFVIVLPQVGLTGAKLLAEKFRLKVASTETPHYTVSIGIAVYPGDGSNSTALLQAADKGLYISKSKGKNAVSHSASDFY